jgi:hypothetical protein
MDRVRAQITHMVGDPGEHGRQIHGRLAHSGHDPAKLGCGVPPKPWMGDARPVPRLTEVFQSVTADDTVA